MIFQEGLRSFYRGATPPIIVIMFRSAAYYSLNGFIRDYEENRQRKIHNYNSNQLIILPLWKVGCIAGLTGGLLAPLLTPFDLIKVQLQVDSLKNSKQLYNTKLTHFSIFKNSYFSYLSYLYTF